MNTIHGDLIQLALKGQFDVIVHGCNCFHTMGAGVAKSIRNVFPPAFQADRKTPYGDKSKLGTISSVRINNLIIVNGYTQYRYGRGVQVDYNAIRSVFRIIKKQFSGLRIGFPKIGAGLGGGNWDIISSIIEEELSGENCILVVYKK